MARYHYETRRGAERQFPHRVDIAVPELGLGDRLNAMHAWCYEHVTDGTWDQHHHSERRAGEQPIDYARFYFSSEADAEAFRQRWL